MGQPLMASVEVADKLEHMERRLDFHERLHEQSNKTLVEVKNVLVQNARTSEQVLNLSRRVDETDAKLSRLIERVNLNQSILAKYAGGLGAITFCIGLVLAVVKLV